MVTVFLSFFLSSFFFLIDHVEAKAASKIKMEVGIALSIFVACGVLLVAYYIFKRMEKLKGKVNLIASSK
jgi:hypothetical protein